MNRKPYLRKTFVFKSWSYATTACLVVFAGLFSGSIHAKTQTMEQWAEEYGIPLDVSYDATRIIETEQGSFSLKERKAPGKTMVEMNFQGIQGATIIREDLDKAWFFSTEMGFYREMDMSQANQQRPDNSQVTDVEEVGRETINGYSTRKFKSEFKDNNGKAEGFMWITDDGIPIKMDMTYTSRRARGQTVTMELEDLQVRAQDASHFELPEGLEPLSLGAMLRMGRQAQRQNTGLENTGQTAGAEPAAEQPTLGEELVEEAAAETKDSLKNETRNSVRKGIRNLFKR